MSPLVITGIIIGVVILLFILIYNGLIGKKNQVENAFASIDTMLKKRYDLIPNLVSAVKTYMTHEKEVLTQITAYRSQAMSGNLSSEEKVELDNKITKTMGGIMVAVENYPDLKSNTNFIQLQRTLNEVEEQISASRRFYNTAVTEYNNAVEMFPSSIIAGMKGMTRKKVFEIPEVERENVKVGDLFNS